MNSINLHFLPIILRFGGAAATALISIVVLQKLGPIENGQFQSNYALCLIISAVLRLGQDNLLLNNGILQHEGINKENFTQQLVDSIGASILFSLVCAVGFLIAIFLVGYQDWRSLVMYAPAMIAIALLWIVTEALRGLQFNNSWALWQGLFPPLAFVLSIILADQLFVLSMIHLPILLSTSYAIALILSSVILYKSVPIAGSLSKIRGVDFGFQRIIDRARLGLTFWYLAILSAAAAATEIFVLAALGDPYIVGIFQPIVRIGGIVAVLINLVAGSLISRMAISINTNNITQRRKVYFANSAYIVVFSIFIALPMLYFGDFILEKTSHHLVDYQFEYSIYIIAQVFQSVFILSIMLSFVSGLEVFLVKVQVFMIIAKIVFISFAYLYFGLPGVFVSVAVISMLLNTVVFWKFYNKILRSPRS